MRQSTNFLWIASSVLLGSLPISVQAQIIPDGTTPTTPAVCAAVCEITGGTRTGENLFHSFSQFNIDANQQVTFNDPGVTNIITRITGGNPSNIFGALEVSGDANLFLINPQGIIFGPTATVNMSGSFVATTANAIQFENQGSFSVTPANNPELLTVNPSAFLFNQIASLSPPAIEVRDSFIFLPDGQSLILLGGNVNVSGGEFNFEQLVAPSGRIELASAVGTGTVGLNNINGKDLSLSFPSDISRGDVTIGGGDPLVSSGVFVFVAGNGTGSFAINARNINLDGAYIQAGTQPSAESTANEPGSITLDATGAISLIGSSLVNQSLSDAEGNAGDIQLRAASVLLDNLSRLNSSAYAGNAGRVFIYANNGVVLKNNSNILTSVVDQGNGGNVQISAGSFLLESSSTISTLTTAQGSAGNVYINVNDSVSLIGENTYIATVASGTATSGGEVNIQANTVSLSDGAEIALNTAEEAGRAGDLFITANSFSLANSIIYNDTIGLGDAGDTQINARSLNISDGGSISTSTNGVGNAGNIFINASEFVTLSGVNPNTIIRIRDIPNTTSSGLFAFTDTNATGRGGNIQVNTGNLNILDGAVISARTRGIAPGGSISVNAANVTATNGGQILTSAFNQGMAGNITVNATNSVNISGSDRTYNARLQQAPDRVDNDGAASGFLARVRGDAIADAGQINVTAPSILLDNQGTISTATTQGAGGQISLRGKNIALRNNGSITATAGTANAGGNGGNIDINTEIFATRNSFVTANAFTGNGGNIRIATQGFFLSPDSEITASSAQGVDGVVEIVVLDDEPSRGLVSLPKQPVDVSNLVAPGCSADTNIATNISEFIITGRGGLPPTPGEAINANSVLADLGTPVQTQAPPILNTVSSDLNNSQPKSLVEAQGWMIGSKGEVVLMAQVPTATTHNSWSTPVACNAP